MIETQCVSFVHVFILTYLSQMTGEVSVFFSSFITRKMMKFVNHAGGMPAIKFRIGFKGTPRFERAAPEFAKAARDFPVELRNNWHETDQSGIQIEDV